jgi:hypothetical protein
MSEQNPIKLFVTHLWEAGDDYQRVFEYLESTGTFYYQNYSAPDRLPSSDKEAQREELRQQIGPVEVVVALASLYGAHPDMLIFQLNYAKACHKPVVLLEAFGSKAEVPKALKDLSDVVIGWNERDLIDSIRRQARHEDTNRWDVIEFKLD